MHGPMHRPVLLNENPQQRLLSGHLPGNAHMNIDWFGKSRHTMPEGQVQSAVAGSQLRAHTSRISGASQL